jgi:cytoskeleton protein RodZ
MIAFGDQLKRARQKAGLSLDELSSRTKIRVSLLDAIERADLTRLPGGFYTKAFLRAYAAEVGLDAQPIVHEYEALFEAPPPAPQQTELPADRNRNTTPNLTELFALLRLRLAPLGMFALAGVLLVFVFNLRDTGDGRSVDAEPEAAGTSGTAPVSPAARGPATSQESIAAASPHQPEPLKIDVRPTGLLWLEGTADGERVVRRLLQPPERLVLEARDEIRLVIGDAGAFAFSINGRPGRPLGRPGEVRTIDVTPGNYQEFLLPAPD